MSGCTTAPPVEDEGGEGTACGHWDEQCFVDELMTGFSSGSLPMSRVTVGSLEDLGYVVNYGAADAFTSNDLGAVCRCGNIKEVADGIVKLTGVSTTITEKNMDDSSSEEIAEASIPRTAGGGGSIPSGGVRRRRRLSDEGWTVAHEYGLKELRKFREQAKIVRQAGTEKVYLGDEFISVIFMEEGEIYSVEAWGFELGDDV